jgi:hypothetical protein
MKLQCNIFKALKLEVNISKPAFRVKENILPFVKTWKLDIVKDLGDKLKWINLIIFTTHCHSWESYILNRIAGCLNRDQDRIGIPF